MASASFQITLTDAKPVVDLATAAQKVIAARAGGADLYEAQDEVDALEIALAKLTGDWERVCSECGEPFAPRHRPHLADLTWVEIGVWLRTRAALNRG